MPAGCFQGRKPSCRPQYAPVAPCITGGILGEAVEQELISWSKKQVSSLRETYPQALAFSLVRLQPGELRVPWAGSEQACLTGKGVTSGESWGAAPRPCQAGSHWHNWKGDSCVWQPAGKQGPCCLGCAAAGAQGKLWGCGCHCQPGGDGYPERSRAVSLLCTWSSLRCLWAPVQPREALLRAGSPSLSCCQQTCEI